MHENEFQSLRQFEESSKFSRRGSSGVFARNGRASGLSNARASSAARRSADDDHYCELQIGPAKQLPTIAAFAEFLCDLLVKRGSEVFGTTRQPTSGADPIVFLEQGGNRFRCIGESEVDQVAVIGGAL